MNGGGSNTENSGDGGSEILYWWRWELKQGFAGTGLRARLGGGVYEMACWPTPSPIFISVFGVAERFFPPNFRYW